jgi:hypothetical protein
MLTEAAGGAFYDLAGPKTDLAFCPLKISTASRMFSGRWRGSKFFAN